MSKSCNQKSRKSSALRWIRKRDADELSDRGLPTPTQVVSNEEFPPIPQTLKQRRGEQRLTELADDTSKRLGVSRRQFPSTSGGMAAAFPAMNSVFGKSLEADAAELTESGLTEERFAKKGIYFRRAHA